MKKYIYTLLIVTLLYSCGGDSEDSPEPTPVEVNQAPSAPNLKSPTNKQLCQSNNLEFTWDESVDLDNDQITYYLILSTSTRFNINRKTIRSTTNSTKILLEKGVTYYWKVKATDSKNNSSTSSVYSFFTETVGAVNHAPDFPELIEPLGRSLTPLRPWLRWSSSDKDKDALTYDIYFGDTFPPSLVLESYGKKSYERPSLSVYEYNGSDLKPNTKYYWKVVVKDGKGAESIGKTWSFTTTNL